MLQLMYAVPTGEEPVPGLEQFAAAELLLRCVWLLLRPRQWLLVWSHPGTSHPEELETCGVSSCSCTTQSRTRLAGRISFSKSSTGACIPGLEWQIIARHLAPSITQYKTDIIE